MAFLPLEITTRTTITAIATALLASLTKRLKAAPTDPQKLLDIQQRRAEARRAADRLLR